MGGGGRPAERVRERREERERGREREGVGRRRPSRVTENMRVERFIWGEVYGNYDIPITFQPSD